MIPPIWIVGVTIVVRVPELTRLVLINKVCLASLMVLFQWHIWTFLHDVFIGETSRAISGLFVTDLHCFHFMHALALKFFQFS